VNLLKLAAKLLGLMESSLSIAGEVPGEREKMWLGVRSELLSLRKEKRSK
jgi:hypothetical protein